MRRNIEQLEEDTILRVGLFFALFFNVRNIKTFIDHGEGASGKGEIQKKQNIITQKLRLQVFAYAVPLLPDSLPFTLPGHLLLVLRVLTEKPGSPLCVSIATKAHPSMGFASLFNGLVNLSYFFIKDKVQLILLTPTSGQGLGAQSSRFPIKVC